MARSLRALSLLVLGLALARSAWAGAALPPPTVTIASPTADAIVKLTTNVAGTFTGTGVTIKLHVDDDPIEVTATIVNTGYLGSVTLPSEGTHTITATATNTGGSDTESVVVVGDGTRPVVEVLTPDVVETGDRTVNVTATVTDAHLNLDDPNTLRVNGAPIPLLDPNQADQMPPPTTATFRGKAPIGIGKRALGILAMDEAGNFNQQDPNAPINVTRTEVCNIGDLPMADPNHPEDPTKPHLFRVNRLDDLPLPPSFDPNLPADFNDPNGCDIRPPIVRHDPNDPNGPPLPGFQPPVGKCTLRAAIQLANARPGLDLVSLPNGVIKLTRQGDGDVRGDLDITDDVAIGGLGRDGSAIDARKLKDRVFDVAPGVSFTLINASLRGGQTPKKSDESGGCLRFAGGISLTDPNRLATLKGNDLALLDCKSGADGGALALHEPGPDPNDPNAPPFPAAGTLDPNDPNAASVSSLTCAIIARSSAKKDGGGLLLDGASLRLRNSTIARTSSGASGGAVANRGRLLMTNATISTNKAKSGGGLAVASGADTKLNNVTFAKNKAKQGMSLSASDPNGVVVSNSILGDKPKVTCSGPVTSQGGNLDPGVTCGLGDDDQENTLPRLDKLATNAGVPTHALQFDSPAIDHGVFATCEPLDERTADRVDGPPNDELHPDDPNFPNDPEFDEDRCDSGAFEFASEAPPEPPPKTPEK